MGDVIKKVNSIDSDSNIVQSTVSGPTHTINNDDTMVIDKDNISAIIDKNIINEDSNMNMNKDKDMSQQGDQDESNYDINKNQFEDSTNQNSEVRANPNELMKDAEDFGVQPAIAQSSHLIKHLVEEFKRFNIKEKFYEVNHFIIVNENDTDNQIRVTFTFKNEKGQEKTNNKKFKQKNFTNKFEC